MSVFTHSELSYLSGERRSARIAIDDLASTEPWRPRGIEVRGPAEALDGPRAMIRIHAKRIVSWGLGEARSARTVSDR